MPDDSDIDDDLGLADEEGGEREFRSQLNQLKVRCEKAGIDFKQDDDPDIGLSATVSMPCGKGVRRVPVFSTARAKMLLEVEFEKFKFLPGYDAVWKPEEGVIEASLQSTRLSNESLFRRAKGLKFDDKIDESSPISLSPPDGEKKPTLEIYKSSSDFLKLTGDRGFRFSLRMINVRAVTTDHALSELISYSNSIFFQMDLVYGYSFILSRERRIRAVPLSKKLRKGIDLNYPMAHVNDDAISLYWYGKGARGMPLLQFLAFYQCVEFYFPRYSQIETRRRISSILKRPTFRVAKDDDLDSVIFAVSSGKVGGAGGERSQLRAVINECCSAEEVRLYIESDKDRFEHFSGKQSKSKFHKIPVSNKSADLRNDIADRIYDIRCKIVHTKNDHIDEDLKMILPFSEDADYLLQDVELVEFISRGVLSASSSELS